MGPATLRLATLLLVLCGARGTQAQTQGAPRIAVMPFRDLSEAKSAVGEAICETVTSDLRGVPGLRVIERAHIDKVLAELSLKGSRTNLDSLAAVKVGTLLGATLIVVGSYQLVAATIRLNARFVDVKSGEVVGTAKVDGPAADFLRLQDRVTVELLKSAKIETRQVQHFARRPRPRLRNLRTVELYGSAVLEVDDRSRRGFLLAALQEDPDFEYAVRDLDALEKRLRQYETAAQAASEQKLIEAKAALAKETDPDKRSLQQTMLLSGLYNARRYRRLIIEARAILANPGPPPTGVGLVRGEETGGYFLVVGEQALKERDLVLRDGEMFLRNFPGSVYFTGIKSYVEMAIADKRTEEEGQAKARDFVAKLSGSYAWDICYLGALYKGFGQKRAAQRLYHACMQLGIEPELKVLKELIWIDLDLGDWAAVRRDIAGMERLGERAVDGWGHHLELLIPADG